MRQPCNFKVRGTHGLGLPVVAQVAQGSRGVWRSEGCIPGKGGYVGKILHNRGVHQELSVIIEVGAGGTERTVNPPPKLVEVGDG